MKSLLLLALVLMTSSVVAGENCNLHIDVGLRISPDALEFYDNSTTVYQIKDHRYLMVDGKQLDLDRDQQRLIAQYDQQIRALLPEVRGMALVVIDLAIAGTTTAIDNFLGESNKISTQLASELNHLKGDVRRYFDSETIDFKREQDGMPGLFGQYFETRIERIVETSVKDSIGEILFAAGREIFSSDGNAETFEARMKRFGNEVDAKIQSVGAELETRGASLCRAASAINVTEDQLRNQIPAIRELDLIRINTSYAETPAVEI